MAEAKKAVKATLKTKKIQFCATGRRKKSIARVRLIPGGNGAIVINKKNIDTSVVSVGTKVALYDEEFDEDVCYTITGSSESDPKNGFISNESPVGKALIGHKVGDKVAVTTPGGEIFYTIKKISV